MQTQTCGYTARKLASVAQLVRALHRNRRATGSIPAKGTIVAFFATLLVRSNKYIKITLEIPIYQILVALVLSSEDKQNADICPDLKMPGALLFSRA